MMIEVEPHLGREDAPLPSFPLSFSFDLLGSFEVAVFFDFDALF
jgi:hypothetical protein